MLDDYEWLFSCLWEQKQIATGGSSVLTRAVEGVENGLRDLQRGTSDLASVISNNSKVIADFEQAWRLLGDTAAFSTYALVDTERLVGDSPRYLTITTAQRRDLSAQIVDLFDPEVRGDPVGMRPTTFAAHVIWDFLNNDGWLSSDAR